MIKNTKISIKSSKNCSQHVSNCFLEKNIHLGTMSEKPSICWKNLKRKLCAERHKILSGKHNRVIHNSLLPATMQVMKNHSLIFKRDNDLLIKTENVCDCFHIGATIMASLYSRYKNSKILNA